MKSFVRTFTKVVMITTFIIIIAAFIGFITIAYNIWTHPEAIGEFLNKISTGFKQ